MIVAPFERHDLAFRRPVVPLGKDGHHAAALQASIGVMKQDDVRARLSVHWDESAGALDDRPLQLVGDEQRRVTEEMDPRLDRKGCQDGERVEPVEMVCDQDIGAVGWNSLAALHVEPKQDMQQRDHRQLQESKKGSGLPLNR